VPTIARLIGWVIAERILVAQFRRNVGEGVGQRTQSVSAMTLSSGPRSVLKGYELKATSRVAVNAQSTATRLFYVDEKCRSPKVSRSGDAAKRGFD